MVDMTTEELITYVNNMEENSILCIEFEGEEDERKGNI